MRAIDADVLKASFEEDGHLSGYIEEYIDYTPTLDLAPKWISVKDGVPPERIDKPGSERCFVYGVTPDGKKVIALSRFYDGEWVLFGELASSDVTHWMLNTSPEPPKEG